MCSQALFQVPGHKAKRTQTRLSIDTYFLLLLQKQAYLERPASFKWDTLSTRNVISPENAFGVHNQQQ